VLQLLSYYMSDRTPPLLPESSAASLFEQAIADPFMNALHRTLLERQPRSKSERLRLDGLIARLQENGPDSLSRDEKRDLLCDPTSMATLHALAWEASDPAQPSGHAPQGAAAH